MIIKEIIEQEQFSDSSKKHQKKILRFDNYKQRTTNLSKLIMSDKDRYWRMHEGKFPKVHSLMDCHSYMLFRNYYEKNKIKLYQAYSCDMHLLCPCCAVRRASKQYAVYYKKFLELKKQHPKLKLYYLVLTIKDGEDLAERYKHLDECFKKIQKRRRDALYYSSHPKSKKSAYAKNSMFADVIAGAYSVEIKRGENSELWHPHVNFLLVTEKKIDYKSAQKEWERITNDSKILKFNYIKKNQIEKSFCEIFKYALKFEEMNFEDNYYAWETLRGKRLLGSFGEFRGLKVDENNVSNEDLGNFVELFYEFNGERYILIPEKPEKDVKMALKPEIVDFGNIINTS